MKKLLVALSLGLVATSVSLYAGWFDDAASQVNTAASQAAQQAQNAIPTQAQAKDAVVDLLAQLSDLKSAESYLSTLASDKRAKVEATWLSLAKPLSESVSKALKQAKDANEQINVAQLSSAIAKEAPAMLTALAKDASPYNGPKLSWNTSMAYAKAYASWTAGIAAEAASNLASTSPILMAKLTECITKFANGSGETAAPETSAVLD